MLSDPTRCQVLARDPGRRDPGERGRGDGVRARGPGRDRARPSGGERLPARPLVRRRRRDHRRRARRRPTSPATTRSRSTRRPASSVRVARSKKSRCDDSRSGSRSPRFACRSSPRRSARPRCMISPTCSRPRSPGYADERGGGCPTSVDSSRSNTSLVCCGTGGVGKTTTAAALAVEGARRGRRVAVITIDPARRLADTLGLAVGRRPRGGTRAVGPRRRPRPPADA